MLYLLKGWHGQPRRPDIEQRLHCLVEVDLLHIGSGIPSILLIITVFFSFVHFFLFFLAVTLYVEVLLWLEMLTLSALRNLGDHIFERFFLSLSCGLVGIVLIVVILIVVVLIVMVEGACRQVDNLIVAVCGIRLVSYVLL